MRTPVRVAIGDRPAPRTFGPVTQTDIVRFAGAGGDFNPLHHDADFASRAGFNQPIAMGQFTAGLLAGWLTDWCGVEHVREFGVRFSSPVTLGDEVVLAGRVDQVMPIDCGLARAQLTLSVICGERTVATGRAVITVVN